MKKLLVGLVLALVITGGSLVVMSVKLNRSNAALAQSEVQVTQLEKEVVALKMAYVSAADPFTPVRLIERMMNGDTTVLVQDGSFITDPSGEAWITITGIDTDGYTMPKSMLPVGPLLAR